MKSRLLWIILSAIVVLMLGVAAAACGDDDDEDGNGAPTGDGEPDAEAYYSDVDRIQNRLTTHLADIEEQSNEAYGDPEKAATSLAAATSAGESALADIKALDVPSVAATAHADLVAAAEAMISALDGMIAGLEGIEGTGPEYTNWLGDIAQTDSEYTQAVNQLREACDGMQDAADNSQVEIVIQCPI